MCRCGDPTFSVLGPGVYSAGRFRFALDWEHFDKESGIAETETPVLRTGRAQTLDVPNTGTDHEVENRLTAALAYSFGDRVTAVVRVPWSHRDLTSTGLPGDTGSTTTANGLADPEVYALFRLWTAPLASDVGRRAWISLVGGVKTPWGRNDLSSGGVRLDEHVQPGTGSTDAFGGVSAFYLVDSSSTVFGSVQYRATGTNDFGYRYGSSALASVAYERKLAETVDSVVELDYRYARQDTVDSNGSVDPNSGGGVLYLSPRVVVDVGRGMLGRLTAQIPVAKALYGDQTEKLVLNVGLSYLF
jgi:hypothetical protein